MDNIEATIITIVLIAFVFAIAKGEFGAILIAGVLILCLSDIEKAIKDKKAQE